MNCISLINGKFKDQISVHDRGLFYGDGFFETMLWKKLGKEEENENIIEYWKQHFERLKKGCDLMKINIPQEKEFIGDIKKILKKSVKAKIKVKGKRKKVYVSEEEDEDMCIYELFKNDIEEYEDIDWTVDSNIFSDSDISEMPELEDVETTFSEDELEYDRAALNVQYSIRHHTPAYNVDNMWNSWYRRVRNIEDV